MSGVTIDVRGVFTVLDCESGNLTPAGQKEKAIIALLALSPGHRRSRKWIQSVLWSDRFDEQASGSLRRAIYSIRRQLGRNQCILKADRNNVWLNCAVSLQQREVGEAELLEDIHVRDPQYQAWLRELRYHHDGKLGAKIESDVVRSHADVIKIVCLVQQQNYQSQFLERLFVDQLATRLRTHGNIEVEFSDVRQSARNQPDNSIVRFEIDSVLEGEEWFVHLRILAARTHRFLWSGRMKSPVDLEKICDGPQMANFIGRAITAMLAKTSLEVRQIPYFAIQHAAEKIFLGDREELELADRILDNMQSQDAAGVAKAWRGYVRLTRALEYGERSDDTIGEAVDFASQSMQLSSENSLVAALASQIHMKLSGDIDRGAYLATKSLEFSGGNPYALHSLSQASVFSSDFEAGHHLAMLGKEASASLSNAFCWDLQCCLTALALGRMSEALDHARASHAKMTNYRPALRYLMALHAIAGEHDEAMKYADLLAAVEPGFQPRHTLRQDYPVETLRLLGLNQELAAALT